MNDKILFVDDEPAVLDGIRRLLHKEFSLETAVGGAAALELMAAAKDEPFAVVVSDMRMPEMDGVQLLSRVRKLSPETVRMALTGQADMQTAADCVNEGSIFRFLTKPCQKEVLAKALTSGLVQYRLLVAEKDLLEKTLSGSIKVLTDVLGLVNPTAFSRAVRMSRYVQHIVKKFHLEGGWRFEVAAMLSQLGCVTLDTDTLEAIYAGRKLSREEQARLDAHPSVGADLLSNIPRLEPIARMIALQETVPPSKHLVGKEHFDVVKLGAQILRVALAYDQCLSAGKSHLQAMRELGSRPDQLERTIIEALTDIEIEPVHLQVRACRICDLDCDMVLQEDVRTNNGLLIVAKGQPITYPLLVRLRNFWERKSIASSVMVRVPQAKIEVKQDARSAGASAD
ncbi:MAG TPA: response regulator [Terriglobales bacterium]|nr:response regulator [Terriglobales bacterium]